MILMAIVTVWALVSAFSVASVFSYLEYLKHTPLGPIPPKNLAMYALGYEKEMPHGPEIDRWLWETTCAMIEIGKINNNVAEWVGKATALNETVNSGGSRFELLANLEYAFAPYRNCVIENVFDLSCSLLRSPESILNYHYNSEIRARFNYYLPYVTHRSPNYISDTTQVEYSAACEAYGCENH